jgi:peptide/nickel transport system permease protein
LELRRYLLSRFQQVVITYLIIMILLFILFRVAPGDPTASIVDPQMTAEDIDALRRQFGLDKSLFMQFLFYVKNFFTGNFGISYHYGEPVMNIIMDRLPNTILLFTTASVLYALAGIAWGKIIAWKKGSFTDVGVTFLGLFTYTLFLPWFALIMIWLFAYQLGWFPLNGMISPEIWYDPSSGFWLKLGDILWHLVLPLFVIFATHFGGFLLIMRSSMLETLREDYILTARAKGLSDRVIRNKHAASNASLPVVTSLGLSLAFSINGGAITETVFSWPGLGRELVFAVSNNDYPLAQMCFMLIAAIVLLANLVVDILYAYLDPRIRY